VGGRQEGSFSLTSLTELIFLITLFVNSAAISFSLFIIFRRASSDHAPTAVVMLDQLSFHAQQHFIHLDG